MTVFVTGGSRGIGRAIVLKFVEEGHDVAFTYVANEIAARETIELASGLGSGQVRSYRLDVKSSKEVEEVVERALDDFETIDALVNNAAIVRNNATVLMSDEEWDDVLATNLSGPFFMARQFLMHFLSNRGGRIVNISSIAQGGSSGQVNYAASKAGLAGLTKTLAREYGPKGITSNAVVLGLVHTDMTDEHLDERLAPFWNQWCPRKRVGTAEEAASLVYYLCSDQADFINGELIHLSGGLTHAP
ncbi:MAG: SDR family oxidoreductase [Bradymonadaceae bacterium]